MNESSSKSKVDSQDTVVPLNEAKKKQLAALKSVSRCLAKHMIGAAKFLPGLQISEKISFFRKKDIAAFGRRTVQKSTQKRKARDSEPSKKSKIHGAKRSRYAGHGQQQNPSGRVDTRRNH